MGFIFEHAAQPDKFENIPQSIYWAVITLASVGYGDISPTTEYAFYPNNTGWGSLVLLHDVAVEDADYGKVIAVKQDGYSRFILPMTFSANWQGELGHNTFLFICPDISGVFIANLYDLSGNILSSVSIPEISSTHGEISLWNLDDRAIISIDHDYNIGETRILCNPRGYPGEYPSFNPNLIVEI
jgi:hypothetical protein